MVVVVIIQLVNSKEKWSSGPPHGGAVGFLSIKELRGDGEVARFSNARRRLLLLPFVGAFYDSTSSQGTIPV